jgi:uncharacterized membrane protein YqhA
MFSTYTCQSLICWLYLPVYVILVIPWQKIYFSLLYFTIINMCADLFDGHSSLLVVSYLGYFGT